MEESLIFLESYVNAECALQDTAGKQSKNLSVIYCFGHLSYGARLVGPPATTYIDQL